jgi:HEPN domain-containing protein
MKRLKKVCVWLNKADEDKSILILLNETNKYLKLASVYLFHAQQYVEKLLKAVQMYYTGKYSWGHKIERLMLECVGYDDGLKKFSLEDCGRVTLFESEVRYPDDDANSSSSLRDKADIVFAGAFIQALDCADCVRGIRQAVRDYTTLVEQMPERYLWFLVNCSDSGVIERFAVKFGVSLEVAARVAVELQSNGYVRVGARGGCYLTDKGEYARKLLLSE